MRTPRLPVAQLLLLATLAACGTGLYDAAGLPPSESGLVCSAGQVVCANACTTEDVSHCGTGCVECGLTTTPPTHGQVACLQGGACGFECLDGFLKCGGACCPTTALAAGPAFTCARLDDGAGGAVRCWGANESGQLGDGTTVARAAPVTVPVPSAVAVGAGAHHACAVLSGGAVTCWGANDSGQVSSTPVTPLLAPSATPISTGATAVVAGAAHTCALLSSGAVKCWGANGAGQLGGTPSGGLATPIASGATALAAGSNHTCALVGTAVKCWGDNAAGQLGGTPSSGIATPIASGIVLLAASNDQTCASIGTSPGGSIDPVLQCWGSGIGASFLPADPQPTPAIPMKDPSQSTIRFDVAQLAVGRAHACVARTGEFVYCFGADNSLGQLGVASLAGPTEAAQVTGPITVSALALGADHACGALSDGRLRCWGSNASGQLGDGAAVTPAAGTVAIPSGR